MEKLQKTGGFKEKNKENRGFCDNVFIKTYCSSRKNMNIIRAIKITIKKILRKEMQSARL